MRAVLLAIALLAAGTADEHPSFEVVVNAKCPARSIARAELSRLFLKKASNWEGGESALPVDHPEGSALRDEFNQVVHRRSNKALSAYWEQEIFSGRDVPPPEKASDEAVLEYVASHDTAIGYVSAGARHAGVKIIELRE